MTARDTRERTNAPSPSNGPPSFVRRHPILAAFGVLAGLSLFAAYWPASAIVVGVAAGAHATGVDRRAWVVARSMAAKVVTHVHRRTGATTPPPAGSHAPLPEGSVSAPPTPSERLGHEAPRVRLEHKPHTRGVHPRSARRDQRHSRRPRVPADRVGNGIDGPA